MAELTTCQKNAMFKIMMSQKHIVICGPAGTGKTFLLRHILDALGQSKQVAYCAPTHAAKQVLSDSAGVAACTIHALFKIHPETYEDEVKFDQSGVPDLSEIDYLVIDEVSMLDGQLFDIVMRSIPVGCRIIGMGDPYQLQPVKNEPGIISPIFFDPRFDRVILQEIVRQSKGNPIIEVATAIRKTGCHTFAASGEEEGVGVFQHHTLSAFMSTYFAHVKKPEDMLSYKILAYANDDVDKFNGLIRQRIYNTKEPVVEGEYLIPQAPVYQELQYKGMMMKELKFHNGETTQVVRIKGNSELKETITLPGLKLDPLKIKYYNVVLKSVAEKIEYPVDIIFDEQSEADISEYLHYAALNYKRMARTGTSKNKMREYWGAFWDLKNRFTPVKGAAACTYHKSQGSTFTGVWMYTGKLFLADPKIRKQLEYVGNTRARKFVHFL